MENLASRYRPKTLDDVVEQSVVVDIVRNICQSDEITNRNFLFVGPAGCGKAQPLDSLVLTTYGFKRMGDIQLGNEVITHTGRTGRVIGIYPQGLRCIYKIILEDGAWIKVADSHLNLVACETPFGSRTTVVTTDYLLYGPEPYSEYSIPVANISEWLDDFGLEDPYRNSTARRIVKIECEGIHECQCIFIDHPDHTYISDNFIPTHNTTTARIIANMINGTNNSESIIEVDAASHSGVDAVRELVAQMRTYPVGSKYKIFILDEAHAITPTAWGVLLKTLEEQPARSVVALCTTNPEKIPDTILSRVQTFQLSKISLDGIYKRLKYIIEQENAEGRQITYDDDAVLYIAKYAQGGMRNAITALDKALSFSTNLTMKTIEQSLGLPSYDDYFDLLNAIAKKDNEKIVSIINTVYNSGVNFVKWFDGFFSFITNIVKFIYLQDINQTMIPSIYQDKIKGYGTQHAALCLKLSNLLVKMNAELKTTQYLQELAISYLCSVPTAKK